jgi:hypothetical protein
MGLRGAGDVFDGENADGAGAIEAEQLAGSSLGLGDFRWKMIVHKIGSRKTKSWHRSLLLLSNTV